MNYLDIAITVPLLYGLIKGVANGLIKEITGLLSLVIGIYISVNFSNLLEPHLSGIFGAVFGLLKLALVVSFLLTMETRFELISNDTKQSSQLYKPTSNLLEILAPQFVAHKNTFEKIQDTTKDATEKLKDKFKKE